MRYIYFLPVERGQKSPNHLRQIKNYRLKKLTNNPLAEKQNNKNMWIYVVSPVMKG